MPSSAAFSSLLAGLLGEDPEGLQYRDAGAEEDGQLAAQVHELPLVDLLLGDLELEEALLLHDRDGLQVAVEQRLRRSADARELSPRR